MIVWFFNSDYKNPFAAHIPEQDSIIRPENYAQKKETTVGKKQIARNRCKLCIE